MVAVQPHAPSTSLSRVWADSAHTAARTHPFSAGRAVLLNSTQAHPKPLPGFKPGAADSRITPSSSLDISHEPDSLKRDTLS